MSYYYNMAGQRFELAEQPLEPPDVNWMENEPKPSHMCSKCGQGIYRFERCVGDGGGETWCADCFQAILKENFTIFEIAEMMGYEVMLCT